MAVVLTFPLILLALRAYHIWLSISAPSKNRRFFLTVDRPGKNARVNRYSVHSSKHSSLFVFAFIYQDRRQAADAVTPPARQPWGANTSRPPPRPTKKKKKKQVLTIYIFKPSSIREIPMTFISVPTSFRSWKREETNKARRDEQRPVSRLQTSPTRLLFLA